MGLIYKFSKIFIVKFLPGHPVMNMKYSVHHSLVVFLILYHYDLYQTSLRAIVLKHDLLYSNLHVDPITQEMIVTSFLEVINILMRMRH